MVSAQGLRPLIDGCSPWQWLLNPDTGFEQKWPWEVSAEEGKSFTDKPPLTHAHSDYTRGTLGTRPSFLRESGCLRGSSSAPSIVPGQTASPQGPPCKNVQTACLPNPSAGPMAIHHLQSATCATRLSRPSGERRASEGTASPISSALPRLHEAQLHEHLQSFSAGKLCLIRLCLELE